MKVFIEKSNKTIELKMKEKARVSKILSDLRLVSDACIVVRNSELLSDDDFVSDSDEIRILSVVSGG